MRARSSAMRQKTAARREKEGERELKTAKADRGGTPEYEKDTVMTGIGRKRSAKYIGYKPSHDDGGLKTRTTATKVGGRTFYRDGSSTNQINKARDDAEGKKQGSEDAAREKIYKASDAQSREKKHREGLKFKSMKRKAEALKKSDV